jgi:hypothetical protein
VILVAALYAMCVIAPPVALAFTSGAAAAHCLTADHRGDAHAETVAATHDHTAHQHADGAPVEHADTTVLPNDTEKPAKHAGSCCGLFCFAAVTNEPFQAVGQLVAASQIVPAMDEGLAGRGPDRLIRPPISL